MDEQNNNNNAGEHIDDSGGDDDDDDDEMEDKEEKDNENDKVFLEDNSASTPPSTQQQNKNTIQNDQIIMLKKQLQEHKDLIKQMKKEANQTHNETRKLRRTVVKLNAELDSAERELDAQKTELERAGNRMEKERLRYKEDKERLDKSHKEDMKAVMEEHKVSIDGMVTSHAEQMVDMEERIKRAEAARAKEGGDMSMELAEAAEREREMLKKVMGLEEEKSTLTSQIASLNTQMSALQSRVESLQDAADVASEQEREADDRLDAALSLHARQIAQRQAREAELERSIADIAAALVVARQREAQQSISARNATTDGGQPDEDVLELKEKLKLVTDEIETFKAQLMLERQKSETLQKELEEISAERTQELSSNLARQKQYDRRVSDLSSEVSRLQSKLRSLDHTGNSLDNTQGGEVDIVASRFQAKENDYKKQISILSEDLLRLRGRLENSSTEVQTLRNRLKAALNRAEIAEKESRASSMIINSNNSSYDIEHGALTGSFGNKTRRRFGGRNKRNTTIRSVLKLDSVTNNETQEALGGTVDSLDLFMMKSLNYLRADPFARMFLILYLSFLHLWTFCLIAYHAHGTLEPSSNVGPEQLLKHSYRHMEQVHGVP